MLALTATAEAESALRALKETNPQLFATVSEHITSIRAGDDRAVRRGRAFRLHADRTSRLVTFYDASARRDLAVVWMLEGSGTDSAVKIIAVEHAD